MADRNPSKKRRQAQNKSLREERAARAEAAKVSPEVKRAENLPSETSPEPVAKKVERGVERSDVEEPMAAPKARSSVFSSKRKQSDADQGTRPARTATGVARATGTPTAKSTKTTRTNATSGSQKSSSSSGSSKARAASPPRASGKPLPPWLDRFGGNEPGGRWVLLSFVMVLVASVVVSFSKLVPLTRTVKGKQVVIGHVTIWNSGLAAGLIYLFPPIIVVGLGIVLARPPERRRTWNWSLVAIVVLGVTNQGIVIYAVTIGCLAWGCWLARKAALAEVGGDPRALRAQSLERRRARVGASKRRGRDGAIDTTASDANGD